MRVFLEPKAEEDLMYWHTHNPQIAEKITALLQSVQENPFKGLGKPEPLKGNFSGYWSRRINKEHRLVYKVEKKGSERYIAIAQCRKHYND
jgi:toxin YoeB